MLRERPPVLTKNLPLLERSNLSDFPTNGHPMFAGPFDQPPNGWLVPFLRLGTLPDKGWLKDSRATLRHFFLGGVYFETAPCFDQVLLNI